MVMTQEMEQREQLLTSNALVVTEAGALGLGSKDELKDVIFHHFGIRKHEFNVFRSAPEPFLVLFSEQADRYLAFAEGRFIEGPYEFRFQLWDADLHGSRLYIPYHIKLSLEGIPQHAWYHDVAKKVLCDEAVIHHIDADTLRRTDQRAYVCWAFCQDPNSIPKVVFLTLVRREGVLRQEPQIHFTRPRSMKRGHVY